MASPLDGFLATAVGAGVAFGPFFFKRPRRLRRRPQSRLLLSAMRVWIKASFIIGLCFAVCNGFLLFLERHQADIGEFVIVAIFVIGGVVRETVTALTNFLIWLGFGR
jgi:hypothetical protein